MQHPTLALDALPHHLAREPGVLVQVVQVQGSAPREPGAWMAVFAQTVLGSIGGGQLEWVAIREAREFMSRCAAGDAVPPAQWQRSVGLGASLGQCCGGRMGLLFESIAAPDVPALGQRLHTPRWPLALFGGGHVGHALVQALWPLPFDVTWVDSRDEIFPSGLPRHVHTEHAEPVQSAVGDLAAGSRVLIMSFSHAEDLDIVSACLQRLQRANDLPFVGLIGSRSKWAVFQRRLLARGFAPEACARITCPIGLPGIRGKAPAVIAASVVAQLLLDVESAAPLVTDGAQETTPDA